MLNLLYNTYMQCITNVITSVLLIALFVVVYYVLSKNKKSIIYLYLAIWCTGGIYFGIAGILNFNYSKSSNNPLLQDVSVKTDSATKSEYYIYKGMRLQSWKDVVEAMNQKQVSTLFEWMFDVHEVVILILASCFMGAVGSIIRILANVLYAKEDVQQVNNYLVPFMGFFIGFIVLCLSYAFPKFLTTDTEITLNPTSVIVLSLLAGICSQLFFQSLSKKIETFFETKTT